MVVSLANSAIVEGMTVSDGACSSVNENGCDYHGWDDETNLEGCTSTRGRVPVTTTGHCHGVCDGDCSSFTLSIAYVRRAEVVLTLFHEDMDKVCQDVGLDDIGNRTTTENE